MGRTSDGTAPPGAAEPVRATRPVTGESRAVPEYVEHIVVGAGPAGLRCAQVLAAAGREVVVLERHAQIGPKTCAGGLSAKAARELELLGLPSDVGRSCLAHAAFAGEPLVPFAPEHAVVRTVARHTLGTLQARWARDAGAAIYPDAPVSAIDLAARTLVAGARRMRYDRLIGADGSTSAVRRALRLPSPRDFYAGEFNVAGLSLPNLLVALDDAALASGYFWIFPHERYTSVGAGVHKRLVAPSRVRPYLERRLAALGVDTGGTAYEGATIEVTHHGFDFPHGVHLVGDAAGVASGLTAEGIHAALVTGEEVGRRILEPAYPSPKTRAWLRIKRAHDAVGRLWLTRAGRQLSFAAMPWLCRQPITRRWVSAFFFEG